MNNMPSEMFLKIEPEDYESVYKGKHFLTHIPVYRVDKDK